MTMLVRHRTESHRTVKGSFILIGLGNEEKEQRHEVVIMGKKLGGGKVFGSSVHTVAEHHNTSSFVNINNKEKPTTYSRKIHTWRKWLPLRHNKFRKRIFKVSLGISMSFEN